MGIGNDIQNIRIQKSEHTCLKKLNGYFLSASFDVRSGNMKELVLTLDPIHLNA